MKKIYLLAITFLFVSNLESQNIVTFNRNVFQINGQPFFMIGFYCDSSPGQLDSISQTKANVVISSTWTTVCQKYGYGITDSSDYVNALKLFLGNAATRNLKVIAYVPPFFWLPALLRDTSIINHPALFGWYLVDEPETGVVTLEEIRHNYELIKSKDPYHPVFIVYGGDPAPIKCPPADPKTFDQFCTAPDSIYDVLMADYYPYWSDYPVPSQIDNTDYVSWKLHSRIHADNKTGTTGSCAFVGQAGNALNCGGNTFRNPDPVEIKYQAFDAIQWAQNDQTGNLGGLLYYCFEQADISCRNNFKNFITYFFNNNFDKALIQANINGLVGLGNWDVIFPILRYYNGSYYLIIINQSNLSYSRTVNLNLGNAMSCTELNVPPINDTLRSLTPLDLGVYSMGNVSFSPRQVRVYKINTSTYSISGTPSVQHPCKGNPSNSYTWTLSYPINSQPQPTGFSWYKSYNGQNWFVISGANSSTYTETFSYAVGSSNTYQLKANITYDGGTISSNPMIINESYCDGAISLDKSSMSQTNDIPATFAVHQNYPNPFNPETEVMFDLREPCQVNIVVYDMLGREISSLLNGIKEVGYHSVRWNASNVSSGVYFCKVTIVDGEGEYFSRIVKMLLVK
jgi:hypothetical protein